MFLDFMDTKEGRNISKAARESSTFNAFYEYWRNMLFERVMRLFVWENTYTMENNKIVGILPKEIEQRLILQGHVGITKIKNENDLTAVFGNYFGVSKYMDEKPFYNYRCPIDAGKRTIGKDIVVIDGNSLRNPIYEVIHHYAILLGHVEVTLVDAFVNARDCGGVPVAKTEKQRQSIADYQGKIFNGQYGSVTDIGNLGLEYLGSDRKTSQSIAEIQNTKERIMKAFYADIGVKGAFEKRSNTVVEEVEADQSLLLFNLGDMLSKREEGADAVNKMFGTNWSVHIAKEIDYGAENEVKQEEDNYEDENGK